jgi:uncharacterized coiled-coil protein SlyX
MAGRKPTQRIDELEDEIKHRDRRIEELRCEIDELRDLVRRMEEQVEDSDNVIERWKEAFDMVETESGSWTWAPFWDEWDALIERHNDLVRRWNKFVPLIINDGRRPVGRPLAASEEERDRVLRLRKAGKSLRAIAEEAEVGLSTVRTIIDKTNGTRRRWQKVHPGEVGRGAPTSRSGASTTGSRRPAGSGRSAPATPCRKGRNASSRRAAACSWKRRASPAPAKRIGVDHLVLPALRSARSSRDPNSPA